MITKEQVLAWLTLTASVVEENKEMLTQLDAAIGDAEHGISMSRGFGKVPGQLADSADKDISAILKGVGMTLVSAMGGAGGSLFGTLFMEAGKVVTGKPELSLDDVASMFRAGLDGVIKRGNAKEGDKTMIDSLAPAVASLERAAAEGIDDAEALKQAAGAAEQGMKATADMIARKGRASYLGERSIGHQDAGATSLYLIIKALSDTVS